MTRFTTSLLIIFALCFVLFLGSADAQQKVVTGQQIVDLVSIGGGNQQNRQSLPPSDVSRVDKKDPLAFSRQLIEEISRGEVVFVGGISKIEVVTKKDGSAADWFRVHFDILLPLRGFSKPNSFPQGLDIYFAKNFVPSSPPNLFLIFAKKVAVPAPLQDPPGVDQILIGELTQSLESLGAWLIDSFGDFSEEPTSP